MVRGPMLYHCREYTGGEIMKELYKEIGLGKTELPHLASIYLPCGYTWVEKELQQYTPVGGQVVLGIDGCDKIVAKNGLWTVLSDEYGREKASQLTPRTYITNCKDLQRLRQEYDPGKIYIMKKNVQRQQGLKITKNLPEMLTAGKKGYVVIQEYVMNPLLIDKRKFDMRVYLLVIQDKHSQRYYRHTGGRCHYTSRNFDTRSLVREIHIPSGYSEDPHFKDTHPETLKELQDYLNKQGGGGQGDYFFTLLDEMLKVCCVAFSKVMGKNKKYSKNTRSQLFGLDVLCDDTLRPILIEINKGPEMTWSSQIEKEYKKKMVQDMFNLLGYKDTKEPNEFILLKKCY